MEERAGIDRVRDLLMGFARRTGLLPGAGPPRRYLWTDAFALCNFLELYRQTGDSAQRDLALALIDQVHRVLGRHREDDAQTGWLSGLSEEEGRSRPTAGGLRIGKPLPERRPGEPYDDRLEWERDGQYYHYLTKWMHALARASVAAADVTHLRWARELARVTHASFRIVDGSGTGLVWKMSTDLERSLVPAMGQHDPLDGLITYAELEDAAAEWGQLGPELASEMAELAALCRPARWDTEDPLGIGGLLFDAARIVQLRRQELLPPGLLKTVLEAALRGLSRWGHAGPLDELPDYRLAFRELGLSIGLKAAGTLRPHITGRGSQANAGVSGLVETLLEWAPLGSEIEAFWLDRRHRENETWAQHRDINEVMLATSIAPKTFLSV